MLFMAWNKTLLTGFGAAWLALFTASVIFADFCLMVLTSFFFLSRIYIVPFHHGDRRMKREKSG